jgi:uncharacterized protein (TIGR01777 family)
MRVVIAGGTGFLGRALTSALGAEGHDVVILTRGTVPKTNATRTRFVAWWPNGDAGPWAAEVDGAGAVVNLAGESIAAKRWTKAQKQRILDSRLKATTSLTWAIRCAVSPPPVLVSGSAVGYYGPLGREIINEQAPPGSDFLANVCSQWEDEASHAASDRTRVVSVRTGLVLEKDGGALPEIARPFSFGAGGPVGSGKQYWPWIHREDWVALVKWVIATPAVKGPVNATAPSPVTNAEFARTLGQELHRPAFMRAPGFALRLMLGEMAQGLLLSGQRAVPARAESMGFLFRYRRLDDALHAIYGVMEQGRTKGSRAD